MQPSKGLHNQVVNKILERVCEEEILQLYRRQLSFESCAIKIYRTALLWSEYRCNISQKEYELRGGEIKIKLEYYY
jgi:hypothetical protein